MSAEAADREAATSSRPCTPPQTCWFEFLLEESLLEKHLRKPCPGERGACTWGAGHRHRSRSPGFHPLPAFSATEAAAGLLPCLKHARVEVKEKLETKALLTPEGRAWRCQPKPFGPFYDLPFYCWGFRACEAGLVVAWVGEADQTPPSLNPKLNKFRKTGRNQLLDADPDASYYLRFLFKHFVLQ